MSGRYFVPILFYIVLFCTFITCSKDVTKRKFHFYHWKLDNSVTDTAWYQRLETLEFQHPYVHIMDIYWDSTHSSAMPKAIAQFASRHPIFKNSIVPVIYIESNVLKGYDETSIVTLASRIIEGVQSFQRKYNVSLAGIQIDCDWHSVDQAVYFQLLSTIKKTFKDYPLSCTIRLYPYNYYKKMGVPPVDYGVLMCYNMGTIKDIQTSNSIIEPALLNAYVKDVKYPLEIKVALPIFGWYVWYRENTYQQILYLPKTVTNEHWLSNVSNNTYMVQMDTMIHANYVRKGDIFRNEFPSEADLKKSLDIIHQHISSHSDIILYHLDQTLYNNYETFIETMVNGR